MAKGSEATLLDLGMRDYTETWNLQLKLLELRAKNSIHDTLVLVEHPHVFTVGKAVAGDIPTAIGGVPVFRVERGGQWTYHGPGQLVGYPILDLNARHRDIHLFLTSLEESLIRAVARFGISAERGIQTGVWVGKKKVASIGAAVRNWISFHGFALNVNTDLSYFQMITPCGFPGSTMTSMKALLGRDVDFHLVKSNLRNEFETAFGVHFDDASPEALEPTTVS